MQNIEQLRAMIKAIPADEKGDMQIAALINGSDPMKRMLAGIEANERARFRQAQKAKQSQQGRPPVVQEKAAQLAQAGLGGLDVGQDMFNEEAYAGGGIVAFDQGGGVSYDDPLNYLSGQDSEGLAMDQARVDALVQRRKLDDAQKVFAEEKQRYDYLKTAAPETAAQMLKKNPALDPGAIIPAAANPAKPAGAPAANPAKPTANPAKPAAAPAAADPNAKPAGTMDPFESIMAYLKGDPAEKAAARKEARDMALLETGLAMLGGDSPYASVNIGQAGARGARGYQERLAGLRKDERETGKGLAEVGLKKYELAQKERLEKEQRQTQKDVAGIYAGARSGAGEGKTRAGIVKGATTSVDNRLKTDPEYLKKKTPEEKAAYRNKLIQQELMLYNEDLAGPGKDWTGWSQG
jgi:uncharacterized protein (UPF0335 family)